MLPTAPELKGDLIEASRLLNAGHWQSIAIAAARLGLNEVLHAIAEDGSLDPIEPSTTDELCDLLLETGFFDDRQYRRVLNHDDTLSGALFGGPMPVEYATCLIEKTALILDELKFERFN